MNPDELPGLGVVIETLLHLHKATVVLVGMTVEGTANEAAAHQIIDRIDNVMDQLGIAGDS